MKNLEKAAAATLNNWLSYIRSGQTAEARDAGQSLIDKCKGMIKRSRDTSPPGLVKAYLFAVLFRGLQDFTDLVLTTTSPDWIRKPETVEKAWDHLWDAKDRLAYVANACSHKTLTWVIAELASLEKEFLRVFGPGLYWSPEIIAKTEICTACSQDFRSCNHIAGRIYNGIRCAKIPRDIEAKAVSVVQHPVDPRCRIWPWQLKEEKGHYEIVGTCILTAFRIDDFLDD